MLNFINNIYIDLFILLEESIFYNNLLIISYKLN